MDSSAKSGGLAIGIVITKQKQKLLYALSTNNTKLFKEMLKEMSEKDVNALVYENSNVLNVAAQLGKIQILDVFIEDNNLNILNHTDSDGLAAIHHIIKYDKDKVLERFVKSKNPIDVLNVKTLSEDTVFHLAAKFGRVKCFKLLLDTNIPEVINAVDFQKRTALDLAFEGNKTEIIECFLDKYKDQGIMNVKYGKGKTILEEAISQNKPDIVKLFLKKDPNIVNQKDAKGRTILELIVDSGNANFIEILRDHTVKTNFNKLDNEKNSILKRAVKNIKKMNNFGSYEMLRVLLDEGVVPSRDGGKKLSKMLGEKSQSENTLKIHNNLLIKLKKCEKFYNILKSEDKQWLKNLKIARKEKNEGTVCDLKSQASKYLLNQYKKKDQGFSQNK